MVKIPIDKIDVGIAMSLYSAQRIRHASERLLEDGKQLGSIRTFEHHNKYSTVLYYYALEEFGKALYLLRLKNETKSDTVEAKLYDHNIKFNEIKQHYADLSIKKFKTEPLEPKEGQSYKWVEDGEMAPTFLERSSVWLTDFNPQKSEWKDPFPLIDDYEIRNKIKLLGEKISELQKDYK